jgi:hypothetical protein
MLSAETAAGSYPHGLDVDHPEGGAAAVRQAAVLLGPTLDADAIVKAAVAPERLRSTARVG